MTPRDVTLDLGASDFTIGSGGTLSVISGGEGGGGARSIIGYIGNSGGTIDIATNTTISSHFSTTIDNSGTFLVESGATVDIQQMGTSGTSLVNGSIGALTIDGILNIDGKSS